MNNVNIGSGKAELRLVMESDIDLIEIVHRLSIFLV